MQGGAGWARRGPGGGWPHLLEAVVLLAVRAVPAVAVPVGHHRVLAAEPAVDRGVCWLRPVDKERGEAAGAGHRAAGDQAGCARPCLDVPRPLGGPARGPRWLRLLSTPAKLPARAGERMETHQIPWLLHTHEATPGHLLPWGSGMGAPGAQAGQATGRTGTRLQDRSLSPRGQLPSCTVVLLGSPQVEGASRAPHKSPGLRAREAREPETAAWLAAGWPSPVEGSVRTGHSGLAGHTRGDRWGLRDNPSPDTRGPVLWGPPSTSLAVGCGNCPTTPSSPRNLDTMWVTGTGGSCLSPRVLALPLLLPCPPPEATPCSGAAAWTPAAVASHATQTTLLSRGSAAPSLQESESPALPPPSRVPSLLSGLGPSLRRVRSRHPWHRRYKDRVT